MPIINNNSHTWNHSCSPGTIATTTNTAYPISALSATTVTLTFTATDICGVTGTGNVPVVIVNTVYSYYIPQNEVWKRSLTIIKFMVGSIVGTHSTLSRYTPYIPWDISRFHEYAWGRGDQSSSTEIACYNKKNSTISSSLLMPNKSLALAKSLM